MKSPYALYLAVFLSVVGGLLLAMGLWLSYEHHVLVTEGVEVQARVEHKEAKGRPGQQAYSAQLVPDDQPSLSMKVRMTAEQYQHTAEGDHITLSYVREHPSVYVLGPLDQARSLGGRDLGASLSGLVLLGIAGGLLWQRQRRPKPRRRNPPG